MNPRVLGHAGGSLDSASWTASAEAARFGQAGEVRTAALLDPFAAPGDGVTVLHDLRIPIKGVSANIDHVVVTGHTVHIIDTKVWKPARYWTFRGKTRRGFERFAPADKSTMTMAVQALTSYLASQRVRAEIVEPIVVVWPSSTKAPMRIGGLRIPGARAVTGETFKRHAQKRFAAGRGLGIGRGRRADPSVVSALTPLLNGYPQRQGSGSDGW